MKICLNTFGVDRKASRYPWLMYIHLPNKILNKLYDVKFLPNKALNKLCDVLFVLAIPVVHVITVCEKKSNMEDY